MLVAETLPRHSHLPTIVIIVAEIILKLPKKMQTLIPINNNLLNARSIFIFYAFKSLIMKIPTFIMLNLH